MVTTSIRIPNGTKAPSENNDQATYMTTKPLVSILIPCYNAAPWIRQCIQSALDQTYSNTEIIVIDDGSTDNSANVIESFGDKVRFQRMEHAGGNPVRNGLTQLARGEWLQYLDADDYLLPGKISSQMALIDEAHSDIDVIYSPVIAHDTRCPREDYVIAIGDEDEDENTTFIRWGAINTGGLLMRRAAVLAVGAWKADQPCCQEHELVSRMMMAGHHFALWNIAQTVYRKHSSETVSRKDPMRVIRLRTEITDKIVDYLESIGKLTDSHREALYIARLESARTAVSRDAGFAYQLSAKAKQGGSWWVSSSPALPFSYQLALKLLGFRRAEGLATWFQRQRRNLQFPVVSLAA